MKVAVVGTGFGERVVAEIWRRLGCETAVFSPRDRTAVKRACAPHVDLVSIHSPPFMHYDHVMLALEHGRNVLCDKPYGRNASEARQMRDRAYEKGALHFLNFEFRHFPGRAKARELLDAGAIGTLQHINWTFIVNYGRKQPFRWSHENSLSGGWIGGYGSHAIDTIRFLFNDEIADCGGVRRTDIKSRLDSDGIEHVCSAEDAYSGWFVMKNGGTANMDTASSATVNLPQRINLIGDDGAMEIVDDLCLIVHRSGQESQTYEWPISKWDPHESALAPYLTAVRDSVLSNRQIAPNFDDGLAAALVMDRMKAEMADLTTKNRDRMQE